MKNKSGRRMAGKAPLRIMELLKERGPHTCVEISEALGICLKTVRVRMTDLKDDLRVEKFSIGRVGRSKTPVHRWQIRL